MSRQGVIPSVQQRGFRFQPKHLTRDRVLALAERQGPLTLDQLLPLFHAELAELGEQLEPALADISGAVDEPPVDRLRRQLDEVDGVSRARRILLPLVRSIGPSVMPLLKERDRAWIEETHFRTVVSLCAPMIPLNASTVLALSDKGQLDVVGGLERIIPAARGGFTVRAGGAERTADVVINAVNPSPHEAAQPATALLASLVGDGAAELAGARGLTTEPDTGRLVVRGRPQDSLYALGDPRGRQPLPHVRGAGSKGRGGRGSRRSRWGSSAPG
jgi:hypothetical protein